MMNTRVSDGRSPITRPGQILPGQILPGQQSREEILAAITKAAERILAKVEEEARAVQDEALPTAELKVAMNVAPTYKSAARAAASGTINQAGSWSAAVGLTFTTLVALAELGEEVEPPKTLTLDECRGLCIGCGVVVAASLEGDPHRCISCGSFDVVTSMPAQRLTWKTSRDIPARPAPAMGLDACIRAATTLSLSDLQEISMEAHRISGTPKLVVSRNNIHGVDRS